MKGIALPVIIVILAVAGMAGAYFYSGGKMPFTVVCQSETEFCSSDSQCCSSNLCIGEEGTGTIVKTSYHTIYTCPTTAVKCDWTASCSLTSAVVSPYSSGTLIGGQSTPELQCRRQASGYIGAANINPIVYGTCSGTVCGDNFVSSSEVCDSNSKLQTITITQNGCQGTIQQKANCKSDCSGWGDWNDVSGTFIKSDKCCGVTCQQQTINCNPYCSGTNYCTYSQLTATCTPTCSNGICGSCSAACGSPICGLTKGQCGVSCSVNSDCQSVTKQCDNYCNSEGKWCTYSQPSKICNPTCSNGQCTGCESSVLNTICGNPSCSFIVGKCSVICSPGATETKGCGVRTCSSSGQWGDYQPQQNLCGDGYLCQ